jgi:hypothetical protein
MSFEDGIFIRNRLLYFAEQYYKHWKSVEDGYYLRDNEMLAFDPMCSPNKRIIHIKVFYGTRDEGVEKGYHTLIPEAFERWKRERELVMIKHWLYQRKRYFGGV